MEILAIIIDWAPVVITICSAIAAATPNTWDNEVMAAIRKAVDLGALNFWNARPK